jgi:hypothetical protein
MVIEDGFGVFNFIILTYVTSLIAVSHIQLSSELSACFPAEISLRVPVLGSCTPDGPPSLSEPLRAFIRVLHPSPFRRSYRCKVSTEREKEYNDNACRAGGRLKE